MIKIYMKVIILNPEDLNKINHYRLKNTLLIQKMYKK